jgi:hypothetical protein
MGDRGKSLEWLIESNQDNPCRWCKFERNICSKGYSCPQYRDWLKHPKKPRDRTLDRVPDKRHA